MVTGISRRQPNSSLVGLHYVGMMAIMAVNKQSIDANLW